MSRIAILLSTYNGEKYLKDQLDSIISQSITDWSLFIRDDGSTDQTMEIVGNYCKKDSRINFVDDELSRLGPSKSFLYLLEKVNATYYLFCDQDDFWLPLKIEKSIFGLKELEKQYLNKPALVFSDLIIVDNTLKTIRNSMWEFMGFNDILETRFLTCGNFITGCTVAINDFAKQLILKYKGIDLMHDALAGIVVGKFGNIMPIREPLILYRQHGNNVIGALSSKLSFLGRLKANSFAFCSSLLEFFKTLKVNYDYYCKIRKIQNITFAKFSMLKLLVILRRFRNK